MSCIYSQLICSFRKTVNINVWVFSRQKFSSARQRCCRHFDEQESTQDAGQRFTEAAGRRATIVRQALLGRIRHMEHHALGVDACRHAGVVPAVGARDVLEAERAAPRGIVGSVERAARHAAAVVFPEDVLGRVQELTVASDEG